MMLKRDTKTEQDEERREEEEANRRKRRRRELLSLLFFSERLFPVYLVLVGVFVFIPDMYGEVSGCEEVVVSRAEIGILSTVGLLPLTLFNVFSVFSEEVIISRDGDGGWRTD